MPDIAAEATDRPLKARAAVASTLLAGLELARDGALTIEQEDDFGSVRLADALGALATRLSSKWLDDTYD